MSVPTTHDKIQPVQFVNPDDYAAAGVPGPHTLYLLWASGHLLYVGQTQNFRRRMAQHSRDKPWWSELTDIEVHGYPDRRSVSAAECGAIDDLKPAHNRPYTDSQRQAFLTGWADPPRGQWRVDQWWAEHGHVPHQRRAAGVAVGVLEDLRLSVTARLLAVWLSSWDPEFPPPGIEQAVEALGLTAADVRTAMAELDAAVAGGTAF